MRTMTKVIVVLGVMATVDALANSRSPAPPATQQAPLAQGQVEIPPRVARVYGKPMAFAQNGDRFVQQGPLPADTNLVGVPLLKLSARGYAQVQLADGPVWIDKMHLQFDREVPQGYCGRLVTSAEGAVVRGVRGVGEECP